MNIVLINHYAGSPQHGMEFRPFYMGKEWVRAGHNVTIVAASFAHSHSSRPQVRGLRTIEILDGISYLWLRTPAYDGNGIRRALNILSFVAQVSKHAKWIAAQCRPDIVIASSTYPLDIVPAWRIARRTGARLVFEVHDLWPLSPIELGGMSPSHPFILLMQWAEDFAYRKADWVVSMLPNAESHMRSRGLAGDKYMYVPNGIDPAEWDADARAELPPLHSETIGKLKDEGRFVAGYAGAHGLANALDTVVRSAALLSHAKAALVLVGKGPEKPALEAQAKALGLDNIHFLPPVPKRTVPALVASMDAMIVCLKGCSLFRFGVSPNKLMDYMMAEKPIIHAIDTAGDIVRESRCGLSIPAENPEAMAAAIRELMSMPESERAAMGRRGKEYVTARHDYRVLASEFLKPVGITAWAQSHS